MLGPFEGICINLSLEKVFNFVIWYTYVFELVLEYSNITWSKRESRILSLVGICILFQVFSGAVINWEQLSKDWVNSETGERVCFEMFRVSVMMVDRA